MLHAVLVSTEFFQKSRDLRLFVLALKNAPRVAKNGDHEHRGDQHHEAENRVSKFDKKYIQNAAF